MGLRYGEKAKYVSFLLEKSFGHKSDTAALVIDITGDWSPLWHSASVALGAMHPLSPALQLQISPSSRVSGFL